MAAFDPYHKWLGIPPEEQPPHHYRMLAIKLFESDPDVIQAASDGRMTYLRTLGTGDRARDAQRLLNETASACACLLNAAKKANYDAELRTQLEVRESAAQREAPPTPAAPTTPIAAPLPAVRVNSRSASKPTGHNATLAYLFYAMSGGTLIAIAIFAAYAFYGGGGERNVAKTKVATHKKDDASKTPDVISVRKTKSVEPSVPPKVAPQVPKPSVSTPLLPPASQPPVPQSTAPSPPKPASVSGTKTLAIHDPNFSTWIQTVSALPAPQQMEEFTKKFRELNPSFQGKIEHRIHGEGVIVLKLLNGFVGDLSPVRVFSNLATFDCIQPGEHLTDLSPLQGMKLNNLLLTQSEVDDLTPLRGMPLKRITVYMCKKVRDLSPLQGMPIDELNISGCENIADLSPLKGSSLKALFAANTKVTDLSSLSGLKLELLDLRNTPVTDLSPLRGLPLKTLDLSAVTMVKDFDVLPTLSTLKELKLEQVRVTQQLLDQLKSAVPACKITANQVTPPPMAASP